MKITDLSTQTYSVGEIQDFASKLGPLGVKKLLNLIYLAYIRLNESGKIKIQMNENEITEELYNELLGIWFENGDFSIRPIHEKPIKKEGKGPGKSPAIDFCFRDEWDSHAYFGSECKKLENSNKRRFDDYIVGGVCRYLSNTKNKKCSEGSLISYVVNGNMLKIVSEIKSRVDNVHCFLKMERTDEIGGFSEQYRSSHARITNKSPFLIYHLFFAFTHTSD